MGMNAHIARATGEICGQCGYAFDRTVEGEVFPHLDVRMVGHQPRLGSFVICVSCSGLEYEALAAQRMTDEDGDPFWPYQCHGCGCDLGEPAPFTVMASNRLERNACCSERCRQRVYKRVQRGGPDWPYRKCRSCGCSIPGTVRSDARYCSGRCRAAAHRIRSAEA